MVTQVLLPVSTPQAESHTVLPAADNLPAPGDNVPGVPTPPDELNTGECGFNCDCEFTWIRISFLSRADLVS